jgi:hypothetical protein
MDTSAQYTRSERLTFKYDALREKSVIANWKKLQQQFVAYNDQV